ncbi:MAG: heat-inducible transcriptional repressor HrcA [Defluviitaleaceae bacterium]|nr:heat-inducible transcriptional repressor HrcA [Defluviitaleaceae bacterium]
MLNERKLRILEAIIDDYIATAEPIGSRTIAKKYDFGLSSATIRNEMSDLEDMGYVAAPHASSGRIPSDKGYRLYVDEVMKRRRLNQQEKAFLAGALTQAGGQVLGVMREMARAVAVITKYTIVVSEPQNKGHKIKLVQVFVVDGPVVALVVVTDHNVARNQVVVLPSAPSHGALVKMSVMLTALLEGATLNDLTELYISMAKHRFAEAGLDDAYVDPLMTAIASALRCADSTEVYAVGVKNILDFPEFADLSRARAIVGMLEEKEGLAALAAKNCDDIKITIGHENENAELKDCSIIKAKVSINNHNYGNMAIIGPTRMDYAQVLSVLQTAYSVLSK